MAKDKKLGLGGVLGEMLHTGIYKRSQGRVTRQVTCASVWIACFLGAWRLLNWMGGTLSTRYACAGAVVLAGIWIGFRLVNIPQFTDFLISVEAEMRKVSWPSRGELVRSSVVVIFVIFSLAAVLFAYDVVWRTLFVFLGVRPS